jgi:hypothetical protein
MQDLYNVANLFVMLFQAGGKYQDIVHINNDLSIVNLDAEYVIHVG